MKYVKLRELAASPPGTIFSQWEPRIVAGLNVLQSQCSDVDFFYCPLTAQAECPTYGVPDPPDLWSDRPPLELLDSVTRWGTYDEDEEFIVYEPADVERMVKVLTGNIKEVLGE